MSRHETEAEGAEGCLSIVRGCQRGDMGRYPEASRFRSNNHGVGKSDWSGEVLAGSHRMRASLFCSLEQF